VKPQSAAYLEKSRDLLNRAPALLAGGFTDEAGRAAYLAGFHAAQALIFERQDRVFKSHNGVQGEFARLVKDDPGFDLGLRAFLGRSYNLKAIADYESGPGARVSEAQAVEAIEAGRRFVAALELLLGA
jgi:uncharacterized protein (UPF0332 family)